MLVEDVPVVGQTTLDLSHGDQPGVNFNWVQLTPDPLRNDAAGVSVFSQATGGLTWCSSASCWPTGRGIQVHDNDVAVGQEGWHAGQPGAEQGVEK